MRRPESGSSARLAGLAAFAALLGAVELLVGASASLAAGYPRAEVLIFLDARPWLLLLLALAASGFAPLGRVGGYALFLAAGCLAESFYLLSLGNRDPWPETLRVAAAAAALVALLDLVLGYARRSLGRIGLAAAAVAAALLLGAPAFHQGWRAATAPGDAPRTASNKPDLLLMTALPIIWGEGGAFDPASRPAGAYRLLQEEFTVRPIDTLDAASLGGGTLLLLAQPRWLAPAELVALDTWVRAGGRTLILTDPLLEWPSELALGDIRRAPPVGLLGPLLDHWGVAIEGRRPDGGGVDGRRRLVLRHSGRLVSTGPACLAVRDHLADCRIGRGRATIVADADLLRDDLWMAPGPGGDARDRRLADNPVVVADLLDALAGVRRERIQGSVLWARSDARPLEALRPAVASLLLLAAFLAVAGLLLRRRTR